MSIMPSLTEADTCRRFITPALVEAGWDPHQQILEQRSFTDGRVVVAGTRARRRPGKRADYILRYRRDHPLAVVEAKPYDSPAGSGLQQAIDYAEILQLPFAYASNGREIIEHDFLTGEERKLERFPGPDALWLRWKEGQHVSDELERFVLTPSFPDPQRKLRYYQTIAANRAVEALARGKEKVLLTLATGTGKSFIAFQVCWRLWQARWNRKGTHHRPKILYLADRNVLLTQPMLGVFAPFGDALHRIEGEAVKSREMYFATYQQVARDESRPGLYREYDPDFFDLVVVDECHRGSARDDSNWHEILDYFSAAAKLGMTATPLREDNRDTYAYFGIPLIQYSLAEGIEDGFLAPYKVRRVSTDVDAVGWRPEKEQKDRYGEEIPDDLYLTKDFERTVVLAERTEAIAKYITRYLVAGDRFAKTIVFCVDQEHALNMRHALARLNPDLVQQHPDYVCRVTADEGDIGKGHLDRFQDIDTATPVILTTSEMLTTGVDAPTVKNICLCRVVNSMSTFKQIVGRGTRLRTDYDKWYFSILDFTGTATRNFADPEFDGPPVSVIEQEIDDDPATGVETVAGADDVEGEESIIDGYPTPAGTDSATRESRRKFYVDDVHVEVVADLVYELDADGKRLRTVQYSEYAGEKVRGLYRSAAELRTRWLDPKYRREVLEELENRGIDLQELAEHSRHPDSDPFDLLCHLAFSAPLRTRRERAEAMRRVNPDFWERYSAEAREVLSAVLDKYAEHGVAELAVPTVLAVPPISEMGNIIELTQRFGGAEGMREAFSELQRRLYSA